MSARLWLRWRLIASGRIGNDEARMTMNNDAKIFVIRSFVHSFGLRHSDFVIAVIWSRSE
jgi:hypothetical protein